MKRIELLKLKLCNVAIIQHFLYWTHWAIVMQKVKCYIVLLAFLFMQNLKLFYSVHLYAHLNLKNCPKL